MKRLRSKVILVLIVINTFSSLLSDLLTTPLVPELFGDQQSWMVDLMKMGLRSGFTLVIFTIFIILGVREITAPVLRLAKAAKQIADGDYAVEIPETTRKDEVGQLEKSFAIMTKELQSTEYMQKDFVSNVSHEYKTPLAVIAGYARLLDDGNLTPEERAQYSGFIAEEATRLSEMTSNILLLSKLENQSIQPAFEPFSLDEQLRQAALLYLPVCQEKGIALDIDMPSVRIQGNPELLMHVWTNLLQNATKFTQDGGIIALSARIAQDQAIVKVADNGIGMDETTKAHVFDQFYQGDTSRKASGNGLGLPLVRRIVQLHGGNVQVDSAPETGTTFTVTLPATHDT